MMMMMMMMMMIFIVGLEVINNEGFDKYVMQHSHFSASEKSISGNITFLEVKHVYRKVEFDVSVTVHHIYK